MYLTHGKPMYDNVSYPNRILWMFLSSDITATRGIIQIEK